MYRSIKESLSIIKKIDNGTSITEYFLRCLAKSGKIVVLNIGSKFLINIESLFDFLKMDFEKEYKNESI